MTSSDLKRKEFILVYDLKAQPIRVCNMKLWMQEHSLLTLGQLWWAGRGQWGARAVAYQDPPDTLPPAKPHLLVTPSFQLSPISRRCGHLWKQYQQQGTKHSNTPTYLWGYFASKPE